ncbi:MAG: sugar kinase [Actinomycetota bacterium]|nr:sugar kinase [Actinomycetota bacterium]
MDPLIEGAPSMGSRFGLRVAGAETNYGIGLTRLGVGVRWVSKIGDDPFGHIIADALGGEGLDLGYLQREPNAPTGLFFKWRSAGRSHVVYYRRGSAASRLSPEDVPEDAFDGIAHVHLTGITMAISESAGRLVVDLARRASERSIPVSFDPNFRPALWESPLAAFNAHARVLPYVDWYLCGLEEGHLLFRTDSEQRLVDAIEDAGARNVAVRVGERGVIVREGEHLVTAPPLKLESVLDEVGAGDGFAAGFTYGLLRGWALRRCARAGNLIAAAALRGTGDWETLPYLEEVRSDLQAIATTDGRSQ